MGETQQEALDQLLLCLVEQKILIYPDQNKEFMLHIDDVVKRLGAVLLQYQDGNLILICHGGKTFTSAEKKYYSFKLLFLESNELYVTNLEIPYNMHHTSIFTHTITLLLTLFLQEGSQHPFKDG